MHGRPRKAPKPEDLAAFSAKAEKLRILQSQFLSNHHQKIYTKEAVELSAKLLEINPECYTAWNYRKLAVQHSLFESNLDPDAVNSILNDELRVVENALRQNFKSYGAWYHRKWVLNKGHSSIENELRLLDKLQNVDPRNFHAWNYRRFVAALLNRSDEDELNHTQDLIDKNISNYSAWHNRSVLVSNLMKKKVQAFLQKDEVLIREYELVRDAVFTDEDDQSGWFYHLWLLDQTVKAESPLLTSSWPAHGSDITLSGDRYLDLGSSPFNTYHVDSGSLPLILYFNQAVEGVNMSTVTVSSGFNVNKDVIWKPILSNNSKTAHVWVGQLKFPKVELDSLGAYTLEVTLGHSQGIISSCGFHYSHPSHFSFTVHVQPAKKEPVDGFGSEKISWRDENFHIYEPDSLESDLVLPLHHLSIKNEHELSDSSWQEKIIDEEISNFRELLDCKIGKLTLARLLTARDALVSSDKSVHSEEVLRLYSELMKLDPPHSQFYKDEHSLILFEKVISGRESLLSYCFRYRNLTSSSSSNPICLRLNGLSLSRLGSFEKLLWVQMLDLSHNELRSIEGLEAMQLLSHLNLSKNKLGSFTSLESLRHLKSLKVLDLSYNEIGAHSVDTTRYLCSSPLCHSIGSEWDGSELVTDGVSLVSYWEAFFILKGLKLTQLDITGNAIADEKFTAFLAEVLPALKWLDGVQLN
ncbi:hypothetical protein OIU74_028456 [Salix koriyanagi]|uniref:Geranylgeranyl transferase type-2 subunit alpha n=1 Tax=Salix koriyanagi TaxID=2511006 RepID=A0A9Q0VDT6_9ROSI|nr:hypothetical protein OIU74_028456 [Salix koriyanagi]KAJ6745794.1 hypothetical protein OIU74_028456 [Salix koriyanagi]KAJ6745795.1 hypothetical protein OIU74_028456 [Salix koriyanagi]